MNSNRMFKLITLFIIICSVFLFKEISFDKSDSSFKKEFTQWAANDAALFKTSQLALLKNIDIQTDNPVLIREGMHRFWKIIRETIYDKWTKNQTFIYQVKDPYIHSTGIAKEKTFDKQKGFTLLTFNICFTPKEMPAVFGGLAPWEERVDSVVELIEEADSDVVCLQEIFDHKAYDVLYEKLQSNYAHIYTDIGPLDGTKNFLSIGFGSGLLVASKYPLTNPTFHPFSKDNPYLNRGVFSFSFLSDDVNEWGTIYTTHLEPFKKGEKLRKKEIKEIISIMEKNQVDGPSVLCGDLNLSPKEGSKLLQENFIDLFHNEKDEITFQNCTSCDFTHKKWNILNKSLTPEILDYILLYKKSLPNELAIEVSKIESFNEECFLEATSDHHALFSRISAKKPPEFV